MHALAEASPITPPPGSTDAASALGGAERRAAARDTYRASLRRGAPLTGAELAAMYSMSERWGRDRTAEVNSESPTDHNGTNGGGALPATPAPGNHLPPTRLPAGNGKVPSPNGNGKVPSPNGNGKVPSPNGNGGAVTSPSSATMDFGGWVRTAIRAITAITVIGVAMCAARASYDHQRHVVEMAGESQAAWYLPLSVDGMMLVASLNMLVRRWENEPAGRLTWCALLLGGAASLSANVAAAEPTLIGRLVAAWPPLCLIVSYELLMQQLPTRGTRTVAGTADDRTIGDQP